MVLDRVAVPVVLAPMAGGPGTPALAAAVTEAGGLGFLAAGYLTPERLADDIAAARRLTDGPLGVNVFGAPGPPPDPQAVEAYAALLAPRADEHGVALGRPRHDDDHLAAKLDLLVRSDVQVVSSTFGPLADDAVAALHAAGIEVWSTVTDQAEAEVASARGADVLIAQGAEAGGHQGSTIDDDRPPLPLHDLLAVLADATAGPPVVAAGGIMDAADVEAALAKGARAVQVGTAFLLCPEAGTADVHRAAVARGGPTVLTRTFSGRRARGLANGWTMWAEAAEIDVPIAYPDVHHLTTPLRAHGRTIGDPDLVNLWAGTGVDRVEERSAAEVVAALSPRPDGSGGDR